MVLDLSKNLNLSAKGILYPIILGVIMLMVTTLMPKKLTKSEMYITFGVVGYVVLMLDIFIMATMFDVFDLGSPDVVGLGDIISYGIIAPCLSIIFLNFYKQEKKWIYVSVFSLVSFLYEIGLVYVGYMDLKGWNSLFSIPVHIISYGFWFPWHLRLMRRK
jgi:hypothetical protein